MNFSPDGQWLNIAPSVGVPVTVHRLNLSTGERQPLLNLTPRDPAGVVAIDNLLLTPDGRGYVYAFVRRLCDLYVVEGLQ